MGEKGGGTTTTTTTTKTKARTTTTKPAAATTTTTGASKNGKDIDSFNSSSSSAPLPPLPPPSPLASASFLPPLSLQSIFRVRMRGEIYAANAKIIERRVIPSLQAARQKAKRKKEIEKSSSQLKSELIDKNKKLNIKESLLTSSSSS